MGDARLIHLQIPQPALFLLKPVVLELPHPVQPAFENETNDLMKLASIEKSSMTAANVDDGA